SGTRDFQIHPRASWSLQARPPDRIFRAAQDHFRQDSARAVARHRIAAEPGPPSRGVLGRGFSRSKGRDKISQRLEARLQRLSPGIAAAVCATGFDLSDLASNL